MLMSVDKRMITQMVNFALRCRQTDANFPRDVRASLASRDDGKAANSM